MAISDQLTTPQTAAGSNPYFGKGGAANDAQAWLYDYFSKTFGRAPTDDEIAQFAPIYQGSDPHVTDVAQGNAAVARYHQQQNPNAQFEAGAKDNYGTVSQLFQQNLGRDATQEEKDHFGTLLASKQYDPYSIAQMLQNLPEHVKQQDAEFQKQMSDTLQKQDSQYYNEQVLPGIAQSFAKNGRSFDSSGYAQALAQAAQQQNRQRETFLSNLTANQYAGSQDRAYQDYANNRDYTRNYYDTQAQNNQNRLYQIQDFNMQKQAYDQYLSRYGKRSNAGGIGALAGGALGAGIGAFAGGPMGAMAGYSAGSGLGGGVGSFF